MNWFAYRLPGDEKITTGCSERLVKGLGTPGFAAVPFDGCEAATFTIPSDSREHSFPDSEDDGTALYPFPEVSTDKSEHEKAVRAIRDRIADGELEKCVLAKVIVKNESMDLRSTFMELCASYPEAFVFCFHTAPTGTWIGASPEILLEKKGDRLITMALAGTRPAGTEGKWDHKNIEEQRIVTDFISDCISHSGLEPVTEDTVTHNAGPVEHLKTVITAELQGYDNKSTVEKALETAMVLSPTPALSGYPRDKAIKLINETEKFSRGYYGGFCGPINKNGDFSLFVNLRSILVQKERFSLFAGGGIMRESDPASEWNETERKASTCLDKLHYKTV